MLTDQHIAQILTFLNRTPIEGKEAETMVFLKQALRQPVLIKDKKEEEQEKDNLIILSEKEDEKQTRD